MAFSKVKSILEGYIRNKSSHINIDILNEGIIHSRTSVPMLQVMLHLIGSCDQEQERELLYNCNKKHLLSLDALMQYRDHLGKSGPKNIPNAIRDMRFWVHAYQKVL